MDAGIPDYSYSDGDNFEALSPFPHKQEIAAVMVGVANVGIFRRLTRVEDHRTTGFAEQAGSVNDTVVVAQGINEGFGITHGGAQIGDVFIIVDPNRQSVILAEINVVEFIGGGIGTTGAANNKYLEWDTITLQHYKVV